MRASTPPTGLRPGQRLGFHRSRNPSNDELDVLAAYTRWTLGYVLGVADFDRLEAFKAGAAWSRRRYSQPRADGTPAPIRGASDRA